MTGKEFAKLALAIKTYFPRDNVLPSNETMELWFDMLKDLDYEIASMGLKAYVSTNKFAPTIADIREYATKVTKPQQLNEMEAWSLVSKAIRNSGYHSEEEFEKLPPLVQKAVGQPSQLRMWAIGDDYNEAVVSSNFIKTYRVVAKRNEDVAKMPEPIAEQIRDKSVSLYLPHIDEKLPNPNTLSLCENKAENEEVSVVESGNLTHHYTKQIQKLREELFSDKQTAQN